MTLIIFLPGSHTLPVGLSCLISLISLHYSKDHWEKPREFYPYHFLPDAVSKRHPTAWGAFGFGSRACLGQ